jgi:hypothetical protein
MRSDTAATPRHSTVVVVQIKFFIAAFLSLQAGGPSRGRIG